MKQQLITEKRQCSICENMRLVFTDEAEMHSSHGHITRAQRYCYLTLFWSVYNWTIHPQIYIDYI